MDDCLTKEDYEIAEKNGISKKLAYSRFATYGWDKEEAITKPKHQNNILWQKWKPTAESNGIYCTLFHHRIKLGMSPEVASTRPIRKDKRTVR